jgi:uncharacterized protein
MSYLDSLVDARGQKKLLSIDGGGIRGLIAIEFLSRIETLLRVQLGNKDLVLAQYFDYVAGTSTGAIIATLIALGFSTAQIRSFYLAGARTMFEPANIFQKWARKSKGVPAVIFSAIGLLRSTAIFTQKELEREIKSIVGADTTFGTDKIKTLLMIVTYNVSTDSPWPLSNNPRAKYNHRTAPDGKSQSSNLDLPLWQLVRASTAAPVFFPPEKIELPDVPKPFIFQDGGITVYNNPAFQLFLMATLPPYKLEWTTGERDMLLVSVGTGLCESANLNLQLKQMNVFYAVAATPGSLMRGATTEQDLLCRVFGRVRGDARVPILDSEIGSLVDNTVPVAEKLFTYVRYNVELSRAGLDALGLHDIDPKAVQPLDGVKHVDELLRVGETAAERNVQAEDFEGFLSARTLPATA